MVWRADRQTGQQIAPFWLWLSPVIGALVALIIAVSQAFSQAIPVPRVGSCPSGYTQSGGYCNPMGTTRCRAIPKVGQCPSGYTQSGAYCIEIGNCQR